MHARLVADIRASAAARKTQQGLTALVASSPVTTAGRLLQGYTTSRINRSAPCKDLADRGFSLLKWQGTQGMPACTPAPGPRSLASPPASPARAPTGLTSPTWCTPGPSRPHVLRQTAFARTTTAVYDATTSGPAHQHTKLTPAYLVHAADGGLHDRPARRAHLAQPARAGHGDGAGGEVAGQRGAPRAPPCRASGCTSAMKVCDGHAYLCPRAGG